MNGSFDQDVPEEGVILRRLTADDPMVIRVYQIADPQG